MQLRQISVGCFGGGTGMPALLGGLKRNPWLSVHAVVTMFDSGGSSGQLRDELGVLPPGDVLRCALALARNEGEARRVLLARLPTLEHERLRGHTGGNLLLLAGSNAKALAAAEAAVAAIDGVRGAIMPFPGGIVRALARMAVEYYGSLAETGSTEPFRPRMLDFDQLNRLVGTPEMIALGKRYAGGDHR